MATPTAVSTTDPTGVATSSPAAATSVSSRTTTAAGVPLSVGVSHVVTVTGPSTAFDPGTNVTVQPVADRNDPATNDYVVDAGTAVAVTFPAGALHAPLTLNFDVTPPPGPDWVPVSMHQDDGGQWEPILAAYDGHGHLSVTTDEFSIHLPSWLNPLNWFRKLADAAASFLAGRSSPDSCPPNGKKAAPSWATVSGPPDGAAHVCLFDNADANGDRVEVQLKSNRGTYLVATLPPDVDYTYTPPKSLIATTLAARYGRIKDNEVIVAPGDTITYGLRRSASTVDTRASVHANNTTIIVGGLAALLGEIPGAIGAWYTMIKCVANPGTMTITLTSFAEIVSCAIDGLSELRDGDKSLAAARELLGNKLDEAAVAEQGRTLLAEADKFKGWGKILKIISLVQGVANVWTVVADELKELLDPGAGDVTVHLETPPPATTSTTTDTNGMTSCPDIQGYNRHGDTADRITTAGAGFDCETAANIVRDIGAQHSPWSDPSTAIIDGLACNFVSDPVVPNEAGGGGTYTCEGGGWTLTFHMYAGE